VVDGAFSLQLFCKALNPDFFLGSEELEKAQPKLMASYRLTQQELLRLTRAWFDAQGNIKLLLNSDPVLARAAYRFPARLVPTATGQAVLEFFTSQNSRRQSGPIKIALSHFINFLLNPENDRLAGPCKECGRYYIKKTVRQKVYCSEGCGRKLTSRESNRLTQEEERSERIRVAQRCIDRWGKQKTRLDWKEFVHLETQISKHFLTCVVKKGLLLLPDKAFQAGMK